MSQEKRLRKAKRREVRMAQRLLRRQGATTRLARVKIAVADPVFQQRMRNEISFAEVLNKLRNTDQIRDLALKVLGDLGVDTQGINLVITWRPKDKEIDYRVVHRLEVAQAALAEVARANAPELRVAT